MTVLRREDVQSRIASWDGRPYRMLSSPVLAIVPLIIRRLRGPLQTRLMVSFTTLARSSRIRPLLRRYGLKRRPEEAGQLTRDGDGDLGCGLVLLGEASEAATQSLLRLVCNRNHTTGLSLAPSRERHPDARPVLIVPRGFDQQPADQRVPRPRDATAAMFLARGILTRHEAEVR